MTKHIHIHLNGKTRVNDGDAWNHYKSLKEKISSSNHPKKDSFLQKLELLKHPIQNRPAAVVEKELKPKLDAIEKAFSIGGSGNGVNDANPSESDDKKIAELFNKIKSTEMSQIYRTAENLRRIDKYDDRISSVIKFLKQAESYLERIDYK